jgi:hypothetical protein
VGLVCGKLGLCTLARALEGICNGIPNVRQLVNGVEDGIKDGLAHHNHERNGLDVRLEDGFAKHGGPEKSPEGNLGMGQHVSATRC